MVAEGFEDGINRLHKGNKPCFHLVFERQERHLDTVLADTHFDHFRATQNVSMYKL